MHRWLARRNDLFDSSGIRRVFDLAAQMERPINLSIGQPDFPVPAPMKQAAIDAIQADANGYSVTQGTPRLLAALQEQVDDEYGQPDRKVLITSGTSGALVLAMLALVDPGDEVICFDPWFVMYPALTGMVGGRVVKIDTYPDFQIDVQKVTDAITPRTKAILANSPANPTGVMASDQTMSELARLAAERGVALVSDEIYRQFCYERPLRSPAHDNPDTIVTDAFSKSHAATGWRVGWLHGPAELIDRMAMLQQYTFVCSPHPLQCGALAGLDVDISPRVAEYRERRDQLVGGLSRLGYDVASPDGAFYAFVKAPPGYADAHAFVSRAIEHELLIIPGGIFSDRDTHFRISYAAAPETIDRGLDVLGELAGGRG